jgi:hypothetical protein
MDPVRAALWGAIAILIVVVLITWWRTKPNTFL